MMKKTAKTKPARRFSAQTLFLAAVVLLCLLFGGILLWPAPKPAGQGGSTADRTRLEDIPFNGARAYDYLKQLCALGPRRSGSPAMAQQQKLLVAHFEKLGGKVEMQRFSVPHPLDGSPVPMANIIIRWNPQSRERILLCGHYDTLPFPMLDPENPRGVFVGANDNASGIAILMELAHQMADLRLPLGVDFVLLDGEELIFQEKDGQKGEFFRGSTHFARQYAAGHANYRYRYGVLLDMVGNADLQICQEQNSLLWPDTQPLVEQIWATAARLGLSEFIAQPGWKVDDDHVPLHNIGGIPTCDVIDFDYPPWQTEGDTPDKCSASSLAKVGWVISEWLKGLKDKG